MVQNKPKIRVKIRQNQLRMAYFSHIYRSILAHITALKAAKISKNTNKSEKLDQIGRQITKNTHDQTK